MSSPIVPLQLPKAQLQLSKTNKQLFVWCVIRKKKLILTPEEWVRQHFIHYLIEEQKVAISKIAAEHTISVNKLTRRCDIVVFNAYQQPCLIVECKAPEVELSKDTLYQIAQYNQKLNVAQLVLTNGKKHVYCAIKEEKVIIEEGLEGMCF